MADGEHSGEAQAKFHAMTDGTPEDWMIIAKAVGRVRPRAARAG